MCQARDVRQSKSNKRKKLSGDEMQKIKGVLQEAERWNISQRGTAAVINAVGASLGTVTNEDQSKVISKSDVKRLKGQLRKLAVEERKNQSPLAIGLDERKDQTKVLAGEGERGSKRYIKKKEEHCTVIFWPGETYEGHIVPKGGSGRELASSVGDFLVSRSTNLDQLRAVLSDGTSKMTGAWTGLIAELERRVSQELGQKRTLQRVICMLHHAEKLFEKIFFFYDGVTAGPDVFTGPIGTLLSARVVHQREIVGYKAISNTDLLAVVTGVSSEVFKELNHDHQQLLKLVEAVLTGKIGGQWAKMAIGPVCSAR